MFVIKNFRKATRIIVLNNLKRRYNVYMNIHVKFMKSALELAKKAKTKDEVPVGALIVKNGKIISKAYNERESKKSPIAHAEVSAIIKAAKKEKGWRLSGCTLYVTLEPCPMCAGAIINARIDEVVFGAYDKKAGAFGSLYNLSEGKLNHIPKVTGGVLENECSLILKEYFKEKRN